LCSLSDLIGSEEGVAFGKQLALMLVDCTPLVGNFFEGFIDLANDLNVPLKYAPIFADDSAEEWFFSYFQQELVRRFQLNDFKIRNVDRHRSTKPSFSVSLQGLHVCFHNQFPSHVLCPKSSSLQKVG